MAHIIRTNGSTEEINPQNGTDFGLEEMQKAVGGYIEVITISNGRIMILDEEGKLKYKDINPEATNLAEDFLLDGDFIVGDVIVCAKEMVQ